MNTIPWIEKYRPSKLKNVVLDKNNRQIFQFMINNKFIPNLLFYGPPGTGKTTTIINIIKEYHQKYFKKFKKELIIHLNASDERGIEIVRTQLSMFVKTKPLFSNHQKFIILDEVDCITKNAQQALSNLIQQYNKGTSFCLICNYISRINKCLKNELIGFNFCSLEKEKIFFFLDNIIKKEKIQITNSDKEYMYNNYKSDIRSMINFLQTQNISKRIYKITNLDFEHVLSLLKTKEINKQILNYIYKRSIISNISILYFIKKFIIYLLTNDSYDFIYNKSFLKLFKYVIHNDTDNIINYFLSKFKDLYKL